MTATTNQTGATKIDFNNLQPVEGDKNRIFVLIDKELDEKQQKAGYYLSLKSGGSLDGIYMGLTKNPKFGGDEASIKDVETGKTYVVKASTSLLNQLMKVTRGTPVRITLNGKVAVKTGKWAGKMAVSWTVLAGSSPLNEAQFASQEDIQTDDAISSTIASLKTNKK
jgi:hypothetical protein